RPAGGRTGPRGADPRRTEAENRGRDAQALRPARGRRAPVGRDCRPAFLLARRAALRIPRRGGGGRGALRPARPADLGGLEMALSDGRAGPGARDGRTWTRAARSLEG